MDYRKNFVKAMKLTAEMDQILAELDTLFQHSVKLSIQFAQGIIPKDIYLKEISLLGSDRKHVLKKYNKLQQRIREIEDDFGGQIKE